jgi:cytosine/adenosine deaminase-related metal-dependent hydrolase
LRNAAGFIEKNSGRFNDRLQSFLAPAQIDTCSEKLLKETQRCARDLGVRMTIHGSQSHVEVREMVRRHGMTPVQWLDHIGFLSPDVIVAHAIFLGHHSDIRWKDGPDEMALLRQSEPAVAHCPWPYARRGITMESFARYIRSGITVGLGTDSCPHNMLEEMRWAAVLSKAIERDTSAPTAGEVLHAATVAGAKALGREDLGRISQGSKADVVLVRGDRMPMVPLRDPIKSLVYYGTSQCIDTVLVDGRVVVKDGRVLAVDMEDLCREVQAAQGKAFGGSTHRDWADRDHWTMAPHSLPLWEDASS